MQKYDILGIFSKKNAIFAYTDCFLVQKTLQFTQNQHSTDLNSNKKIAFIT